MSAWASSTMDCDAVAACTCPGANNKNNTRLCEDQDTPKPALNAHRDVKEPHRARKLRAGVCSWWQRRQCSWAGKLAQVVGRLLGGNLGKRQLEKPTVRKLASAMPPAMFWAAARKGAMQQVVQDAAETMRSPAYDRSFTP